MSEPKGQVKGPVKHGLFINEVFEGVKAHRKPVSFVLLGTEWSPPCRYTLQTLQEVVAMKEYLDKIEAFFVDQEANFAFCYAENIPIGFPTIIVFVNGFIANFVADGQTYDPSRADQKTRLIRQLNKNQMLQIAEGAIAILEERATSLTSPTT
jgi:thiol-disulfide isomerase/thioredoxin